MSGFNPSYVGARDDILALVPRAARRVLDVGCSAGALGASIRREIGARVVGVELDPEMARVAAEKLDRVVVGNAEQLDFDALAAEGPFDCICFADVLEHLRDPWTLLRESSTRLLAPDGVVLASLPNIRHHSTLTNLLVRGRWPYRERGIHDRTHLRFFTLSNIRDLFAGAGLEIVTLRRKYRLVERPSRINRVAPLFALPGLRPFLTFQYLVRAARRGDGA